MANFVPIFRINFKNGEPNPLGILVDDPIYSSVRLPDMTKSFEDDLRGYWGRLANNKCSQAKSRPTVFYNKMNIAAELAVH